MEVVARMVVVPRGETCEEETCHTEEMPCGGNEPGGGG